MIEFGRVLVATDFGASSRRALELGVYLSKKHHASLTLLHVYEVPTYVYDGMYSAPVDFVTPIRDAAEKQLAATLRDVQQEIPSAKGIVNPGVPWQQILRTAEDVGADIIVMGTHGHRGVAHALLGSVAEKTVRLSPIPVLTVREQK